MKTAKKESTISFELEKTFILGCGVTATAVAGLMGMGVINYRHMKKAGKVGRKYTESSVDKSRPGFTLVFSDVSAVDTEIERLFALRRKMLKDSAAAKAAAKNSQIEVEFEGTKEGGKWKSP